jgi:hypothetical protein
MGFWLLVGLSIYAIILRALKKITLLEVIVYVLMTIAIPLSAFIYIMINWPHGQY